MERLVAIDVYVSAHVGLAFGYLLQAFAPDAAQRTVADARAMIVEARRILRTPGR